MGRSWRNFFRRSTKQEETSETAVEAPEQEPVEAEEQGENSFNGVVETAGTVEDSPAAEEPTEDVEAPVRDVPVGRLEDEESGPEPEGAEADERVEEELERPVVSQEAEVAETVRDEEP